jgi:hypothetical protein
MQISRGEKAYTLAFAAVIAVSAGLSFFIMSGVEGAPALPAEPTTYTAWIIGAGALSGFFALFAARGYMGGFGVLGLLRAIVGSTAAGIIAAAIAGTLIMPVYGTFFAPVIVATEFLAKPWLAIAWYAVMIAAHYLMQILADERVWGYTRETSSRPASSQLSQLTRSQLYNRR